MKVKVKSEYKELVDLFTKLTGARSMWQVFNDCITMFAISISNRLENNNIREKEYLDIISNYKKSEVDVILMIFVKIIDMAEENPFRDLLGELYMQLDMGSDTLGQFFTPYTITKLMAETNVDINLTREEISKKGYITVQEPACGGGANVIAVCEVLYNHDINYQKHCIVTCQDLSRVTALMCYVVLSLLGCSAVVKVGDTLCDPYETFYKEKAKGSEIWVTPMFHLNNCYSKV